MHSNSRANKAKTKPRLVNATFQAGNDDNLAQAASQSKRVAAEESREARVLVADNGFSFVMTNDGDSDDANDNFANFRRQDKKAYEERQAEVAKKFGFEEAKPKTETDRPAPVMVSTATDTAVAATTSMSTEDEEKAELVRRLRQMEDEEEHDNKFDRPTPFGRGRPDEDSIAAAMGRPKLATSVEVSISTNVDKDADHFVYADP